MDRFKKSILLLSKTSVEEFIGTPYRRILVRTKSFKWIPVRSQNKRYFYLENEEDLRHITKI